jgi:hypothetical protein
MASSDLRRSESALAEAASDPGLWDRALNIAASETGSFQAILLPLPATETVGKALEHRFRDGWHSMARRHAGIPLPIETGTAGVGGHPLADAITP